MLASERAEGGISVGNRIRNRFLVTTALVSAGLSLAGPLRAADYDFVNGSGTVTSKSYISTDVITTARSTVWAQNGGIVLTNAGTLRSDGTFDGFEREPDAAFLTSVEGSSVTNSGTISGAGLGIATAYYWNPVTAAFEPRAIGTVVTNLAGGQIIGEAYNAIRLIGGGTVTNAGTITSLDQSAVSMFAFNGQNTSGQASIGTVTNQAGGTITGATRGVVLTGGGVVDNAGTITGGAGAGDGSNSAVIIQAQAAETGKTGSITNSGTLSGWRGVFMAGALASSEIVNTGTITGVGDSGIYNGSAGLLTVRNNAGGQITGATSGVFANSAGVAVTNAGTIRGNGSYDGFDRAPDAGVTIAAAGSSVANSGTISGAGAGITTAYYINPSTNTPEGRAIGTTVSNTGTITGESNDGVRLIGGGTVTNSGTIRGLAGAGTDGISMFAFNGQNTGNQTSIGTITNQAGGTIGGARFGALLSGGGVIDNAGTMTGNVGAIIIQADTAETGKTAKITNSGTITGGDAVSIAGNIASSELTNSGRIEGTGSLGVDNTSAGLLTVDNKAAGEIVGAKSGISATLAAVAVTNAGTIRGNGNYDGLDRAPDAGILVQQAGSSVTNSGTISGAGGGITTAYFYNPATTKLEGRAVGTTVTNSGTITGETNDGVRLIGGGTVTNSGTIRGVAGGGTDGVSMYAFDGQNLSGKTSIGTIDNKAGGTISGARFGAAATSGGGIIQNAGTITGNVVGTYIRSFDYEPGKTGTLTNSGTITGADGALFVGSLASATVTNSGRIEAVGSGSGIGYGIQNASLGTVTVTNQAGGQITGTKSGIWAEQGAVAVTNAGTIRGNGSYDGFDAAPDAGIVISQANSTVSNSGTISGAGAGITTANFYNSGTNRLEGRAIGTTVTNSGSIVGESNDGVRLLGGGTVTNSGIIRGTAGSLTDGIQMSNLTGQNTSGKATIGSVTNAAGGLIEGQRWGLFLIGGGTVENAGTITGAKLASASNGVGGILIATGTGQTGKTATVTNSGTINGLVELNTAKNDFTNSGTVNGNVNLGTGAEAVTDSRVATFTNRGTVNGNVTFGAGDDFYNFIAGATQNGIVDGGAGFDTLSLLFGNVSTPQRVDGSKFVNFEKLVQNHQGTISLFFSGAQTFGDFGAEDGGTLNLENGTAQSVTVGGGSTAEIGAQATVATSTDGATAVAVTGSSGTVSSAGTIQATGSDATAVALTGETSSFANSGTVVASGNGATAIAAAGTSAVVANTGTITTSGTNATAVSLAGNAATITSAPGATIATSGDNSTAIAVTGTSATVANAEGATITTLGDNSVGVAVASTSATVQNDGTLVTTGANSDAIAVTGDGATINNTSNNTIRTAGANSDGIQIAGTGNTVSNTGTIRVADASSAAINIVAGAGSSNQVNNRAAGTILASGDAIVGGAGNETVTNAGLITGNIRLGAGNDTVVLAETSIVNGVIDGGAGTDSLTQQVGAAGAAMVAATGFENYTKTGAGTLTVAQAANGFANVAITEGRLRLADATLTANTSLAQGTRLIGNGRIVGNLAVGGTLAPGNSIGTINVTGNVSFGAGSVYEVETNAAGQSDQLVATGTATLTGGTVAVLAEPGAYGKVTSYSILSAGSVTGQFSAVTSDTSVLVPYLTYGTTGVTLTLARSDLSFGAIATTPTQAAIAASVQALGRGNALYDAVILRPTAQAGRDAFDALSGEIHTSLGTALIDESRLVRETLLGRARSGGEGYGIWGTAFGSRAESQRSRGAAEVDSDRRGIMAGVEASTAGGLRLGIGAGYSDSDVDVDARASHADVKTRLVGAFAGWTGGRLSARLGGAYAWHDVDTQRTIGIGSFAAAPAAGYDAETGQIAGELGYALGTDAVGFEPFASLAHVRTRVDGFGEAGGSAAALTVARETRNATFASFGVRMTGAAPISAGATFLPRLSAAYTRGWGDLGGSMSARLGAAGATFDVAGARLGRSGVALDGGFDVAVGSSAKFGLSYGATLSHGWADQAGKLSLSFAF